MYKIILSSDKENDVELANEIKMEVLDYKIECVTNSRLLDFYPSYSVDVILFDIRFIRDNSEIYDIIRAIRRTDKLIKIIIIYAVNSDEEKLKGFEAGMNDYILAPFSAKVLIKKIEKEIALKERDQFLLELLHSSKLKEAYMKEKVKSLLKENVEPQGFESLLDTAILIAENDKMKKTLDTIIKKSNDPESVQMAKEALV